MWFSPRAAAHRFLVIEIINHIFYTQWTLKKIGLGLGTEKQYIDYCLHYFEQETFYRVALTQQK